MSKLVSPTDEHRRMVRAMAAFGVPQDAIAAHLDLDGKTLRKHFRKELDSGMVETNVKVAQSLFNMATQGNIVAAAIFWMKSRAGGREKNELEITGKEGKPVSPTTVHYTWMDADGSKMADKPNKSG